MYVVQVVYRAFFLAARAYRHHQSPLFFLSSHTRKETLTKSVLLDGSDYRRVSSAVIMLNEAAQRFLSNLALSSQEPPPLILRLSCAASQEGSVQGGGGSLYVNPVSGVHSIFSALPRDSRSLFLFFFLSYTCTHTNNNCVHMERKKKRVRLLTSECFSLTLPQDYSTVLPQ